LFNPVFGHFLDDLSSDCPVPADTAKATISYMKAASAIYGDEDARKRALEPILRHILRADITTVVNMDKTSPDGVVVVPFTGEFHEVVALLINEYKNEFGDGGCDPSTQVGLSVVRFWAQIEVYKRPSSFFLCQC
jgi:hypothetical protein